MDAHGPWYQALSTQDYSFARIIIIIVYLTVLVPTKKIYGHLEF